MQDTELGAIGIFDSIKGMFGRHTDTITGAVEDQLN